MMQPDNLRNIILNERESARLSEISADTYDDARAYLADLLERVYEAEDPLSDDSRTLIEEIHSLRETIRELFQIRCQKILGLAGTRLEAPTDREEIKKMIPAEREMYEAILSALEACKYSLTEEGQRSIIPVKISQDEEGPGTLFSDDSDRMIVRMLADIDSFLGVDGRIYNLKKEDVVALPRRNAEVLCEHNIALNIKPGS
ncbi:MAG: hypothetical protein LUP99_00060 [Methanomicrobiales archaeon]|nr:hypothetical protein [Methanomicrobiales archaeon]